MMRLTIGVFNLKIESNYEYWRKKYGRSKKASRNN